MDLLGVLVGIAENHDEAKKICGLFDDCPYNVMNVVKEKVLVLLFSIPEDHKWWLEGIEKEPEKTLGLSEVEVFFSNMPEQPLEVVDKREKAPCGSDCEKCDFFNEMCKGCPSVYEI